MSDVTRTQLLDIIKQQNAGLEQLIVEREQLRAEVDALVAWASGDQDALSILQKTYLNPQSPESYRIKAAGLALPFERSKPASAVIHVNFASRLERMMERQGKSSVIGQAVRALPAPGREDGEGD